MKATVLFLSLPALLPCALADDAKPQAGRLPAGCEVVMSPGMKITATTSVGTVAITAVDELTRSYTWDGATRAVEMAPRAKRWYGSLGLFNPARASTGATITASRAALRKRVSSTSRRLRRR